MGKMSVSQILVWVLLGLLIFGLMGFGVTSFSGSTQRVASVGSQTISANDYLRAVQQELQAMGAQAGRTVTLEEFRAFGGDQLVLNRLVTQAAITDAAQQQGLSASDETVGREILAQPAFQGADGSFDRAQYEFVLRQQGLSVADFEERIRNDLAAQLLQTAVVAGIPQQSDAAGLIYGFLAEERSISWALFDEESLPEPVGTPSIQDLTKFLSENESAFIRPETKLISYAWLSPEMVLDEISPDEASLRAIYEERVSTYVQEERRLVERLVFLDDAAATDARARLDSGETTFDALVQERGLTLSDIDMGDVTASELGEAAEAVFGLASPDVVGPVQTAFGPTLFRMNAILAATEVTFDEAREELAAEYASDQARRMIDAQIGDVDDLLAGGATLEELEAEVGMTFAQIEYNELQTEGIAAYEVFRQSADGVTENDFPEVQTLEDGGIFAIRLDEVRPPQVPPLEDIRAEVIAAWRSAEIAKKLTELAEAAEAAIASGADFADQSLVAIQQQGLRRDGIVQGAPTNMIEEIFSLGAGDVRVVSDGETVALVRLDAIEAAREDDEEAANILGIIAQQTSDGIARDILQVFMEAELDAASVSINQQTINGILTQIQQPALGG